MPKITEFKLLKPMCITLVILLAIASFFMLNYHHTQKYNRLARDTQKIQQKYFLACNDLQKEKVQRRIEYKIIMDKLEPMHDFLKKYYPNYDYKHKVKEAIEDIEKAQDLPEDIINIYIEQAFIQPHGLKNYQLTLGNIIFPTTIESSYVAVKGGEFGQYRPHKYLGYKHGGFDIVNPYDDRVFAIYDMIIHKKYYTVDEGYVIEAKFNYKDVEGNSNWYFVRYKHLDSVNAFVKKGEKVKKGTVIASIGDSSFGYGHLHIEIFKYLGNKKWRFTNFVTNSTWNNEVIKHL